MNRQLFLRIFWKFLALFGGISLLIHLGEAIVFKNFFYINLFSILGFNQFLSDSVTATIQGTLLSLLIILVVIIALFLYEQNRS